ncbi:deoxyribonuclease-1-like isoform X1 [Epinephelus lanceolatus]
MKIAAFNVNRLGMAKVSDKAVLKNLIKIVSRYSVVVMLEVVDGNGDAMEIFHTELNKKNRHNPYMMQASQPLGRGAYREKFVYFYREGEVRMISSDQYVEEHVDALMREPYILEFECPNTVVKKLVLIPVHTKPEDAETELKALHDVVEYVRGKWKNNNIMILGDFNADGRYLSKTVRKNIRLCSAPYHWLIDEDADTTTSDLNDNTYDRIVVYGNSMERAVVEGSAVPFNFKEAYNLSAAAAKAISDHYPVEVELWGSQHHQRGEW